MNRWRDKWDDVVLCGLGIISLTILCALGRVPADVAAAAIPALSVRALALMQHRQGMFIKEPEKDGAK